MVHIYLSPDRYQDEQDRKIRYFHCWRILRLSVHVFRHFRYPKYRLQIIFLKNTIDAEWFLNLVFTGQKLLGPNFFRCVQCVRSERLISIYIVLIGIFQTTCLPAKNGFGIIVNTLITRFEPAVPWFVVLYGVDLYSYLIRHRPYPLRHRAVNVFKAMTKFDK